MNWRGSLKLFVSFGSWGEIAPLLEIALQLKEHGQKIEFVTTNDYAERVEAYGIECVSLKSPQPHADTIDDFIRANFLGKLDEQYEVIEELRPDLIVCPFYCFAAHAYAQKKGIDLTLTTTTPLYFRESESIPAFRECMKEYALLRRKLGLKEEQGFTLFGLYPWYFHEDIGAVTVGFPALRPLHKLDSRITEFVKEPYGVITRGTLVGRGELNRMVNAIRAHGLKCLYLGKHECDADLSIPFCSNHFEAVKKAKVCITHAGIGTTVDCMGLPMVVDPIGYDQFYNAQRLIDLRCAVPAKDSYIRAIGEALKPHSYLPNYFSLNAFLNEHTPSEPRRHAADVGERPQIH